MTGCTRILGLNLGYMPLKIGSLVFQIETIYQFQNNNNYFLYSRVANGEVCIPLYPSGRVRVKSHSLRDVHFIIQCCISRLCSPVDASVPDSRVQICFALANDSALPARIGPQQPSDQLGMQRRYENPGYAYTEIMLTRSGFERA